MFSRFNRGGDFLWIAGLVVWIAAESAFAQCQLSRLTGSDADGGDEFGFAASITTDYLIVGAPRNDDTAIDSGSAYVFRRSGTAWLEKTKLLSPDPALNDFFGAAVAIDGDYAVVSAVLDDEAGSNAGALYVFHRSGNSWLFEDKITAPDAAEDDELGTSLAIHGNYIIAGARNDDAGTSSGCAYVFLRSGTVWNMQQKLTATDAAAGDEFGNSVAINGEYVIIGSPFDNTTLTDTGSAYVFKRTGTTWAQQQRLVAADGASGNEFGRSVSIDGEYVVVGAPKADFTEFNNGGAAYVFKRATTTWSQQAKLTVSDPNDEDLFGVSVAISGGFVTGGSIQDDDAGTSSGSAYLFRRNGTTWLEDAKMTAADDDPGDQFGFAVAMKGSYVLIGAPYNDDFGASTGSAYVMGVANDCNGNGEADPCDIVAGVSDDINNDGVPDECGSEAGDFDVDNDADVDMKDFATMQNCQNRGSGMLPGCADFDGEPDGDVDLDDHVDYVALRTGP